MRKTLYQLKILFSDFFNRIPAVILIPGIILVFFLAAVFFIWIGIGLTPAGIKNPASSYKNNEQKKLPNYSESPAGSAGDSSVEDSSANSNNNQNSQENISENNNDNGPVQADYGANKNSSSFAVTSGEDASRDQKKTNDNAQTSTQNENTTSEEKNISSKENKNSNNSSLYQGESAGQNSKSSVGVAVGEECVYPEGNVNVWWHAATKKQKNCYISQHGQPDFNQDSPYFCDYENSEDCYYK